MTPFEISVLMHYHTRPGDFRDGDFCAPLVSPTLERFVKMGLLAYAPSDQHYCATEATAVYVNALCEVPAPELRWVMPPAQPQGMARCE